jgi:maltose-binding protein MalE
MVFPMGYCMNINLSPEEAAITAELIKYLTAPGLQLEFAQKYNLLPSRKSVLADSSLQSNPLFIGAMEQMMVGRPMPVNTEMRWIWDAMRPAYQGIFTNQITPEEAGGEMQSLAEELIDENRN